VLLRKPLTRRLYGWVAYTLMRSEVSYQARGEVPGGTFPADFDQRHNLAVVASYKLPNNWQVGGRFRLVSGRRTRRCSARCNMTAASSRSSVSSTAPASRRFISST
jgi:long-subunit fatty acid transport protein